MVKGKSENEYDKKKKLYVTLARKKIEEIKEVLGKFVKEKYTPKKTFEELEPLYLDLERIRKLIKDLEKKEGGLEKYLPIVALFRKLLK